MTIYKSEEVFGMSTSILEPSYVNRGHLDTDIQRDLGRDKHIALRGESKCGKSWLRQKNIPDAIVVQCRLNKSTQDIYRDILAELGLSLVREKTTGGSVSTSLAAETEVGIGLLAKLKVAMGLTATINENEKSLVVGKDLDDLNFISQVINSSGRRLVIEDFHYLKPSERASFAFDLKSLWDFGTYVIIVGIWSENNLLLHLCPDLTGRVIEHSIYWSDDDLEKVIQKGAAALKIDFDRSLRKRFIEDAFGTVGILQNLLLGYLDEVGIHGTQRGASTLTDTDSYEAVAMAYADQLNAVYQTFASRVARGIRQRKKSTGIYAHMLKSVMEASPQELVDGYPTDKIFASASAREPRIQLPNLRQILRKIDGLQVDADGRGLILSYDDFKDEVTVVDKQLFLYRKYATVSWPWEQVISEVDETAEGYQAEGES